MKHSWLFIQHLGSPSGGSGLVAKLCLTLATPWTVVCQAPLSVGFPRQEYWSGLSIPYPGDLLEPGIGTASPALTVGSFTTEPAGKPNNKHHSCAYLYFCVY